MTWVQVSRDPFARTSIERQVVRPAKGVVLHTPLQCAECGNIRPTGTVFQYRRVSDGGRIEHDPHFFCSIGCFRTFHS